MDPVSLVVLALDKGVEKISDLAFESAVRDEPKQEATSQERLLQAVGQDRADDAPPEEIQEAIESGLVEKDGRDQVSLTQLGKYLAPEPES